MTLRETLIRKIKQQGPIGYGRPGPIVSLEDFFTGNDDMGSIGCNLMEHPGIDGFFRLLREVRERPEVQDVLVEVYEIEEEDESMWPFSERVYVITTASRDGVEKWFKPVCPDEISEGWSAGTPAASPLVKEGYRVFAVWWD